MAANIHDVSKLAGVSVSTVSRVINGTAGVKEDLTKRVHSAIKELNYTPSYSARFLKTKRSYTIYYLVPEIKNPYFSSIYDGIRMKMEEHGFMTFLFQPTDPEKVLKTLSERGADGIVIDSLYANIADKVLQDNKIPYTVCNTPVQFSLSNSVSIDLYSTNYSLFSSMIKAGHTKIGVITYKIIKPHQYDRIHAYEQACKDHDIPFNKSYISFQEITKSKYQCGYDGFQELKEAQPGITAVAAVNDLVGIGAMNAAKEMNLDIPNDISIIGFDNDEISQYTTPTLSTVNLPKEKQGELAAEMLLKLILDPQAETYSIRLEPEIVFRDSFKKLN